MKTIKRSTIDTVESVGDIVLPGITGLGLGLAVRAPLRALMAVHPVLGVGVYLTFVAGSGLVGVGVQKLYERLLENYINKHYDEIEEDTTIYWGFDIKIPFQKENAE